MKYNYETVSCAVCNHDNFLEVSKKGQFNLPVNVVLCKNCGLGYLNPRWDGESYMQFYTNDYDRYYREPIKNDNPEIYLQNPIIRRFQQYGYSRKTVNTILDIGSGEGENIRDLGRYYSSNNLYAIEPSPAAQTCLRNLGVNVIGRDVNDNWESNYQMKFDLIILRHVLEHFLHPLEILKKINSILSQNGMVYIAVPNNLKPNSNLENHWFRTVHTYYYNKYSLFNLLALANLKIEIMVEGDKFSSGEIYLMAKKVNTPLSPNISHEHYEIQKNLFESQLKKDKNLFFKGLNFSKKLKRKLTTLWE